MSKHITTNTEWRSLLNRLTRVVSAREDAEDLLQSPVPGLGAYRYTTKACAPDTFHFRTSVNLSIDKCGKFRRRMEPDGLDRNTLEIPDPTPLTDEAPDTKACLATMTSILQELPPKTLEIFLLLRVDEMRYREIAAKLGITVSAVENHLAKAALHIARSSESIDD